MTFSLLKQLLANLIDLVFPLRSLSGQEGEWVTPEEWKKFSAHPVVLDHAEMKRRGMPHVFKLIAAVRYRDEPLLRRAIHQWKYKSLRAMDPVFQKLITSLSDHLHESVIVPVPLHWTRKFSRGFNQADVLACALAKASGMPCKNLLRRTHSTGHQAHRTGAERRQVMKDVFVVKSSEQMPAKIILVDDVCTTGATLNAAAHALKSAGVNEVEVMVVALD